MSGEGKLNPNVPSFIPANKLIKSQIQDLDEDILALKLLNFEKQIEINRKDEEIQRLKEMINQLLTKKLNEKLNSEP